MGDFFKFLWPFQKSWTLWAGKFKLSAQEVLCHLLLAIGPKSTYLLRLSHLYIQIESSERVKSFVFCTRKLLAAKSLPQSMKLRNEETFPIFRIASVMQTTNEIQRSRVFFNSITIQLNFLNFETICKNSRLLQESIWIFNILAWYELNYKSQFFR